jgi:hypothetical protein
VRDVAKDAHRAVKEVFGVAVEISPESSIQARLRSTVSRHLGACQGEGFLGRR